MSELEQHGLSGGAFFLEVAEHGEIDNAGVETYTL